MERFFRRMPVDKPVCRNNYFVQIVPEPMSGASPFADFPDDHEVDPEELSWSYTTLGSERDFTHGQTAHDYYKKPVIEGRTLRLRTERQTLRRLPLSGAIYFGIHTYIFPMADIGVPARLASAVRSWPEEVSRYKGRRVWEEPLLKYLDEEGLKSGEIEKESEKQYPF